MSKVLFGRGESTSKVIVIVPDSPGRRESICHTLLPLSGIGLADTNVVFDG